MRYVGLMLLVALVLATTARADLGDAVDAARDAVANRFSVLDALADRDKPEKKEWKRLGKALDILAGYAGGDDEDSLWRIYKGCKYIVKSWDGNPYTQDQCAGIRDALDAMAGDLREEAVLMLPGVLEEKRRKVQKRIDKGDGKRDQAHGYWPDRAKKTFKYLVKAIGYYRDAIARAERYEAPPSPPGSDVFLSGTKLYNMTDHGIEISDITVTVTGRLGGAPYSYTAKASEHVPSILPIAIASQSFHDVLALMTSIANSDPVRPAYVPGDIVSVSYVIHTSEGDISSGG